MLFKPLAALASLLALTSALPTSATLPTEDTTATALVERQEGLGGRGVTVKYDRFGHARVWGLLKLPPTLYHVFSDMGDPARQLGLNTYEHCTQYLLNLRTNLDAQAAAAGAVWRGLFLESPVGTNVGATVGVQIDYARRVAQGAVGERQWNAFIQELMHYFDERGVHVTPIVVDGTLGMASKRDLEERQSSQICQTPQDLRDYFVDEVATEPDSSAEC